MDQTFKAWIEISFGTAALVPRLLQAFSSYLVQRYESCHVHSAHGQQVIHELYRDHGLELDDADPWPAHGMA